jgi:acyl-CoA synthetase (AMP-forming)/AMP-acid ligase II
MNVIELLRRQVTTRPDAAAIIDTHRRRSRCTSFATLERASARTAALLLREGLRPGDTVLVFQPMSAELYVALLAILRLGSVAMFLDPSAGREHIERCCGLRPPRALIASAKAHLLRLASPALRRIPVKFAIGAPIPGAVALIQAARLAPHEEVFSCAQDTPALLTFTSGSTGQPKAAVRTHGFLLAQHRVLSETLGLRPGTVDVTTLPIFVLANLASGVTSLIPDADVRRPGAIDPAPLLAQILRYHPVSTVASPALLERLAQCCSQHHCLLPSFRKVFTGGAPVFPRLLDQLQRVAPEADIVAVYGSTEAEPIAHIARRELGADDIHAMLSGSGLLAGPPVKALDLRILPDRWGSPLGPYSEAEFAAQCLSPGVPGEIVVSGEHVLPGYLHGHGDHETKFSADATTWHRTGDAGYLDARGRLWLLGRCAARIEDSHGIIYPLAVEGAASQHGMVRRSACVSHRGRRVLAVEVDERVSRDDLATVKQRLAWARIDEIQVHRHLPVDKRHNAKIDYPALYELVGRAKNGADRGNGTSRGTS